MAVLSETFVTVKGKLAKVVPVYSTTYLTFNITSRVVDWGTLNILGNRGVSLVTLAPAGTSSPGTIGQTAVLNSRSS